MKLERKHLFMSYDDSGEKAGRNPEYRWDVRSSTRMSYNLIPSIKIGQRSTGIVYGRDLLDGINLEYQR